MTSRLKVGDVFKIDLNNGQTTCFQFIGEDSTALYSQVVCVFKNKYKNIDLLKIDQIVNDDIDFYTHLHSIKSGCDEGLWQKIGNSEITKKEKPFFRNANDLQTKELVKRWHVWQMNEPWKNVVNNCNLLEKTYQGSTLVNNWNLVRRIELGKYPNHYPKYPGEKNS